MFSSVKNTPNVLISCEKARCFVVIKREIYGVNFFFIKFLKKNAAFVFSKLKIY